MDGNANVDDVSLPDHPVTELLAAVHELDGEGLHVTVAALLGFEQQPPEDLPAEALVELADNAHYAETLNHLPHGDWSSQGRHELALMVDFPAASAQAQSAANNSALARQNYPRNHRGSEAFTGRCRCRLVERASMTVGPRFGAGPSLDSNP